MSQASPSPSGVNAAGGNHKLLMVLSWAWVTIPFVFGVIALLLKVPALF